jgi:hypothetical protein
MSNHLKREKIMNLSIVLQERYFPKQIVECASLEEASAIFKEWRDSNFLGSRDLAKDAGRVFSGKKRVATIAYNGRICEA